MASLILFLAFTHYTHEVSNHPLPKSVAARTNQAADSKAMHIRTILQAANTVTGLAEKQDKDYPNNSSRALTKEMMTKLCSAIDQFHDAEDLMVLIKFFDGLMHVCGLDSDSNYLDVFEEAHIHCIRQLSINDGVMAGYYLEELSANSRGEEMLYIRKLTAEHAKREKAAAHK